MEMTSGEVAWQVEQLADRNVVHAVAPHPDDAISAWSLLARCPNLIVSLATQGKQSVHCAMNGGLGSGQCGAKRVDSWLAYFAHCGYQLSGVQPKDGYQMFEGKTENGERKLTLLLHDYPDQGLMPEDVAATLAVAKDYSQRVYGQEPGLTVDASYKYVYKNPAVASSPIWETWSAGKARPHPDHYAVYRVLESLGGPIAAVGRLSVNGPALPDYDITLQVNNPADVLRNANADGSYGWLSDSGVTWQWSDLRALTGLGPTGTQKYKIHSLPKAV
jgi:hypothetical protein